MDNSDIVAEGAAGWGTASARARALSIEAAALGSAAPQRRRSRQLRAVVCRADRIARELLRLDLEIELWDGVHPPLQHLAEWLETVEAELRTLELDMEALRERLTDEARSSVDS